MNQPFSYETIHHSMHIRILYTKEFLIIYLLIANVSNVKKQMNSEILEEKAATVACLTMDFAMQNVLMQMGLNVVTLDGRVIKQMRTFIFRCYACFKTTSIMTKIFCPYCGNRTLKRVEVTLDENGKQQIHINFRRPLSAKGKKVCCSIF